MDSGNYFGNDAFMWIFALLILCGGGFGGGFFGGNNGVNTLNADMQRGFDNQNAMANQREILAAVNDGTAQSVAATNQLIMQNNYDAAMRDAATNANFTQQIQGVKDMIAQNKIEALQAQVSQLQLAQATAGMLKFPTSWSYGAGPFPPIYGCGCNM